jgi:MFS transporter, PAT family, beta-lactamase induction signal transducer AmpG
MGDPAPRPAIGEVYGNRRMAVLVGLGFASGLPNVVATTTIGSWLSALKIDVKAIGLFSFIAFPYIFKFLWAPLLDRFALPRLGRRRGWLIVTQGMLALTLLAIAAFGPDSADSPLLMLAVLGVAMVFLSASQDIVADAYRTDVLEPRELGAGAAVFVTGYRIAYMLGGALALVLAKYIGWKPAMALLGVLMALTVLVTLAAPEPRRVSPPQTLAESIVQPLALLAAEWRTGLIALFAFALLFRLPDQLATPMTAPLLFQHLGFDSAEVGWIRQALGFFITIIGALAGGAIVARAGLGRSLITFGLLQALSNAGFMLMASQPPSLWLMAAIIGVENFCNGLVGAGFVAFLMSCCDRRYSATQYAILSGLMAAMALIAGSCSGFLVAELGYVRFFAVSIAAGLPGMVLIALLPRRRQAASV